MADEIISKRCPKCKQVKPISEFYKNPARKDGINSWCKVCENVSHGVYLQTVKGKATGKHYRQSPKGKATAKRYKQSEKGKVTNKQYRQSEKGKLHQKRRFQQLKIKRPEIFQAKDTVNYAIKTGVLPRPDSLLCHYYLQNPDCEKQAKQYHHHKGYEREHWLDVVAVCVKCHPNLQKPLVTQTKKICSTAFE